MAWFPCFVQVEGSGGIPNGKTVMPVNDVAIWLQCAGIAETYTTLSQVLNDTTTLLALISNNNAVDYMVRSTAWASDVCADETAMQDIGSENYCANTLLANNTWCNAICNSAYFESVLNIKVPEMTSNTTPSGEVFYSSTDSRSPNPWHVFNSTNYGQSYENGWMSEEFTNAYIGYEFEDDVKIYMCRMLQAKVGAQRCCKQFKVRCGELHTEVSNTLELPNDDNYHIFTFNSAQISSNRWEIDVIDEWTSSVYAALSKCQFYGRTNVLPNGKTATPTDDVATWLRCADLSNNYTTLSEVLNDSITLQALIQSANAVDYMVRSTTWANDVCADSTAMTIIGANDYCADTLLADTTWCTAICNSSYFESVLNIKVPVMTSDTTPSGECIAESYFDDNSKAFKVFDGDDTTHWNSSDPKASDTWVGYTFTSECILKVLSIMPYGGLYSPKNVIAQGKTVSGNWIDIGNSFNLTQNGKQTYLFVANNDAYTSYRIYINSNFGAASTAIKTLQFYGRAQVNSN